ncbi:unnamed protein product [Durusdinium trenchii]|uniref:Uncharacterized protein n=1 Tax=Durusdinium trenchii TaxID=1381693 RepID=A0ABP0MBX4_9DINO
MLRHIRDFLGVVFQIREAIRGARDGGPAEDGGSASRGGVQLAASLNGRWGRLIRSRDFEKHRSVPEQQIGCHHHQQFVADQGHLTSKTSGEEELVAKIREMPLPTGPPEAFGARFRCTCCQQEVFESQLEYHASYCLPPARAPPTLPRIAERRESDSRGRRSSEDLTHRGLQPTPSWETQIHLAKEMLFGPEESPAPLGKRWWRWEDSEIQVHHAKAEERSARKRQEILEEKKRQEEEHCTFTPRLVARRSRSCGRMETQEISPRSGRWQDWLDQQLESKKSKLESVESEMYQDVTHHPSITRLAQTVGQAREEADALNVFERLYQVARDRSRARKLAEASANAEATPPPSKEPWSPLRVDDQ